MKKMCILTHAGREDILNIINSLCQYIESANYIYFCRFDINETLEFFPRDL